MNDHHGSTFTRVHRVCVVHGVLLYAIIVALLVLLPPTTGTENLLNSLSVQRLSPTDPRPTRTRSHPLAGLSNTFLATTGAASALAAGKAPGSGSPLGGIGMAGGSGRFCGMTVPGGSGGGGGGGGSPPPPAGPPAGAEG